MSTGSKGFLMRNAGASWRKRVVPALWLGSALVFAGGCVLITDIDRTRIPADEPPIGGDDDDPMEDAGGQGEVDSGAEPEPSPPVDSGMPELDGGDEPTDAGETDGGEAPPDDSGAGDSGAGETETDDSGADDSGAGDSETDDAGDDAG